MGSEAGCPEWYKEPCLLGIDEAGRGPVLGSMVYACCFAPVSSRDALATRSFADSKTLTEEKREALYAEILADGGMGYDSDELTAEVISAAMLSSNQTSLNVMACDSTCRLIQRALQRGVNLTEVYVDTVGDPERYADKLSSSFPGLRFTVCPKADALYPIVSAASIVAKVTRDRGLKAWQPREQGLQLSRELGSGYPGDAPTKAWLDSHLDPVFGFPSLVRFSWQTAKTLLDDRGVPVKWAGDEDPGQQKISFGPRGGGAASGTASASVAPGRHAYFRARKLQPVTSF